MSLRFLTAGESHGKCLIGVIEGIPAGIALSTEDINKELTRRQGSIGRGQRMKIEQDRAEILSGVRWGRTLGSPIAILIENKDWANWKEAMSSEPVHEGSSEPVTKPRPGHADLSGAMKYDTHDLRNILERSSARETAMRVGLGAIVKKLLKEFGITIGSYVIQIGNVGSSIKPSSRASFKDLLLLHRKAENSLVRCPDETASKKMEKLIDRAAKEGTSLGGIFEVFAAGLPPGLGSHIQWDRRLDGRLAQALMSIQAIKGVEIGSGFNMAGMMGRDVMDVICYANKTFLRKTNNSGGIEGGMTNGMPIILKAAMKPIPTQRKPLKSVDIITKKSVEAAYERSDICAVASASVIGEAMTALILGRSLLAKTGGDSLNETKRNFKAYLEHIAKF